MSIANWHSLQPWEQKQHAEQAIEAFLDHVEQKGRELDDWEARDLLASVSAILARMYTLSLSYTDRAGATPTMRAGSWDRSESTPSISQVRDALYFAKGAPAAAA